jgi:hypothetical protein
MGRRRLPPAFFATAAQALSEGSLGREGEIGAPEAA